MKKTYELSRKIGKKLLIIVGILIIPFAISSCSDDDEVALTKTQLLTQSSWKFSAVSTGDPTFDAFFQLFFTGFTITFNTDGTTLVTFASDSETGIWEFTTNETKILLDKGTMDEQTFDIESLTAATLVFTFTDPDFSGLITLTLVH